MAISNQLDLSKTTVLIVEDVETSNRFYEAALKGTQANLLWAVNGKEAIRIFDETEHIDIILLDVNLPDFSGFEILKHIRKTNKTVKVIVQTAYVFSGEEEKSFELGADFFEAKPIRFDALLSVIKKCL